MGPVRLADCAGNLDPRSADLWLPLANGGRLALAGAVAGCPADMWGRLSHVCCCLSHAEAVASMQRLPCRQWGLLSMTMSRIACALKSLLL